MKLINTPVHKGLNLAPIKTNMYGIEIELENFRQKHWKWPENVPQGMCWNLVADPSLRQGVELVSVILTQAQLKPALEAAQWSINKSKVTANSRCGVHVHTNMLNLTWGQMWSFIAIYTFMEPEIFAKFAPERHENHFCVPMFWNTKMCADLNHDINILRSFSLSDIPKQNKTKRKPTEGHVIADQAMFNIQTSLPTNMDGAEYGAPRSYSYILKKLLISMGKYKYGALTTYRIPDLGTLEIRLLPGTTDMNIIKKWVALIGRIKYLAKKYPEPLNLQQLYEKQGANSMWRKLSTEPYPYVLPQNKDEAEECAYKIIGYKIQNKDDFNWEF